MSLVVDYAFGHPTFAALANARLAAVGRYVSESAVNDTNGKNLIPSENDRLKQMKIPVVLFAEESANDMLGGFDVGKQRAQHFDAVAKALGRPNAVMFCTADFDATPANQTPINAYLDGAASVIGRARTGMYGGYYPVSRALNAGKCTHAVQTFAWSRFSSAAAVGAEAEAVEASLELTNLLGVPYTLDTEVDQSPTVTASQGVEASLPSHSVLVSRVSGRTLPGTFLFDDRAGLRQGLIGVLGGGSVDFDEAVAANFGQDPAPSSPAPTLKWGWYTVDGNESLAGVVRHLNAKLSSADQIRPAEILRLTLGKNNGQWDPPGAGGILGDWVNLVLGDTSTGGSPDPHVAIGKGAKLWVPQP